MSSRVIINTLKFCTKEKQNLLYCLKLLDKRYVEQENNLLVEGQTIFCGNNVYYMNIESTNLEASRLFSVINSKLAEIEKQVLIRREEDNKRLIERAQQENSLYEARKLKKVSEDYQREQLRLELEKKNYVDSKRQEVIRIAKEKGYTVQEKVEAGKIKLKLIKRIY